MIYPQTESTITLSRSRLIMMLKAAIARGMGRRDFDLAPDEYNLISQASSELHRDWLAAELDALEREFGK